MKNKNHLKKYLFIIIASFVLSFSPIQARTSHAWMSFAAAQYKQMLEITYDKIKGIMLGVLKKQAVTMLNKKVDAAVGGTNGKNAKFITNWESYLLMIPKSNTDKYINDYLSKVTNGKGSTTGYQSTGFGGILGSGVGGSTTTGGITGSPGSLINSLLGISSTGKTTAGVSASNVVSGLISSLLGGGGGGSYASQLTTMAKKQTSQNPGPQFNFQGDPGKMLAAGNFKLLSQFLSPQYINTPNAFVSSAQQTYTTKLAQEQQLARTKATAYQGFIGTGENAQTGKGIIKTPGSLTMQATANAKDLGNKIIASAQHPEEIISALISQMMTQLISQGLGMVKNAAQKALTGTNAVNQQVNTNVTQYGPGALYGNPSNTGNCSGKNDGVTCTLTVMFNNSYNGICKAGLCSPAQ